MIQLYSVESEFRENYQSGGARHKVTSIEFVITPDTIQEFIKNLQSLAADQVTDAKVSIHNRTLAQTVIVKYRQPTEEEIDGYKERGEMR